MQPKDEQPGCSASMIGPDGSFTSAWLRDKSIAPVPVSSHVDAALSRRIAAGCRAVGAPHILRADSDRASTDCTARDATALRLPIDSGHEDIRPPAIVYTPDRQGAILFQEAGYALIAGTESFMSAAVGEGVDTARARFSRYARTLAARHPTLVAVAAAYPPAHRAWSRPADVAPGSGAAQQLALLDELVTGARSAPEFAHDWWKARRTSQTNGERIQTPLAELFDRVFMILEDYAVDPDLREPGDLSDEDLRAAVREVWGTFRHVMAERR